MGVCLVLKWVCDLSWVEMVVAMVVPIGCSSSSIEGKVVIERGMVWRLGWSPFISHALLVSFSFSREGGIPFSRGDGGGRW